MKGLWAWVIQRLSAVLLILLLGTHFGIMHFVNPTVEITFMSSSLRLQGTLYFLVDSGLLFLGMFHGLNGIRNIILDYWPRSGKTAGVVLSLIGIAYAVYASTALAAFVNVK